MDENVIKGGADMPFRHSVVIDGSTGKVVGQYSMDDWIKNRNTRVLNISHDDLDGAVSAIVIRHVYNNCITVKTNYSGEIYRNAFRAIGKPETYDAIIFSDFCPDDAMVEAVHNQKKPYLVLDHHQTAQIRSDDPYGVYEVKEGECGALLCYRYFSKFADLKQLYTLCLVTNDHDLWLRKMVPISDDLNTLFHEYGYERFMNKFNQGMGDDMSFSDEAKSMLAKHDSEVDKYIASCPQKDLPHNGRYIECEKFSSDINLRLTPMYDWVVMAGTKSVDPGMTQLSFRTKRTDINIGKVLKELGRGGGGHPAAAGQTIPTAERDQFIEQVGDILFGKN